MSYAGRAYLIENWLGHLEVFEGTKKELAAALDPGDTVISAHNSWNRAMAAGRRLHVARNHLTPSPAQAKL